MSFQKVSYVYSQEFWLRLLTALSGSYFDNAVTLFYLDSSQSPWELCEPFMMCNVKRISIITTEQRLERQILSWFRVTASNPTRRWYTLIELLFLFFKRGNPKNNRNIRSSSSDFARSVITVITFFFIIHLIFNTTFFALFLDSTCIFHQKKYVLVGNKFQILIINCYGVPLCRDDPGCTIRMSRLFYRFVIRFTHFQSKFSTQSVTGT